MESGKPSSPVLRQWAGGALIVLGSWAACTQSPEAPGQTSTQAREDAPGTRTRVGGLLAFQARSEVRFLVPEGSPEPPPHQLVVSYAFPDRCRWRLEPIAGRPGGRRIAYRFGARAWLLEPDQPRSRAVEGPEAAELLTALELRRALMLWPHGQRWEGEGVERRAELGDGHRLRARLEPKRGLPVSIESLRADGTPLERLSAIEWSEREGRTWPARFELEVAGQAVWREEIRDIELDVRHVDVFFQPHDLRPAAGTGAAMPALIEVPRAVLRRVELPEDCSWDDAQARFAALRVTEVERLTPLDVEEAFRVELGRNGQPVALLLHLEGARPAVLPAGYRLEPAGSALASLVADEKAIDIELLAELERAVPPGCHPSGPPRARIRSVSSAGPRAQVILPLAP